ncbi:CoA transferase subunit A [Brevibacillus sp. NRS-1366]|uniref:CoA transferase subunit A n=1 Tax=Brevibacillus sp. NRS-1366 TaxID=3233899 RepID=UPI003D195EAD
MAKIVDVNQAISMIQSGQTLMVGGFGLTGSPLTLIDALEQSNVTGLTIISNNLGEPNKGLGKLAKKNKVKKAIGSFFTSNIDVVKANKAGEIEIELLPQGTLAEAIRAGGAGIGAFYVLAGVGTQLSQNKETRLIKEKHYLYQESLKADVALIKAHKADKLGNLIYRKSAGNFNSIMATAASTVIVEVDEIVEVGQLSPKEIITPHLYVDYLVSSVKEVG